MILVRCVQGAREMNISAFVYVAGSLPGIVNFIAGSRNIVQSENQEFSVIGADIQELRLPPQRFIGKPKLYRTLLGPGRQEIGAKIDVSIEARSASVEVDCIVRPAGRIRKHTRLSLGKTR